MLKKNNKPFYKFLIYRGVYTKMENEMGILFSGKG